ncbi:lysyl-tRNA synthetase [Legionella beliardensis]|uniref:Lysyl-tRNA synthetase n=1 Tax=Legionella beliardensis TaxID=91822 RepID=A0A378I408_9GAMM|nr:elongation factor P--(R)-beta-lysine ligase [Legionella beliardensis]STX29431.1 lysyl-tRNA synthetase [Legionella beliardensis]
MSWQPSATIKTLRARALILAKLRDFFTKRGYLEVETPCMARFGITDVYLSNIKATFREQLYHLQTSPEYHMKRLLAAGSGPIFQLARVFRDDELGRWHNPEFTMLEWYQLGIDHHELMTEMDELLQLIVGCPPLIKKTYQQVFQEICQLNPLTVSIDELKAQLKYHCLDNVLAQDEQDRDQYLFLLMSHVIEPALAELPAPVAIYDFPASQASLAKVNHGVAERFEIYIKGIELANGFHELTDAQAQQSRFAADLALRKMKSLDCPMIDEYLLDALAYGLPVCSGVALGIDRLIALALGYSQISKVLAFDFSRA